MKKYIIFAILTVITLNASAQSVAFVNIPSDSYTLGMGGSSVAMNANAFALVNNPASMSLSDNKLSVAASYGMWQPSSSNNSIFGISGFGKIGDKIGVGISGKYFTHQPYNITGENGYVTGTYSPKEYVVEAGASYSFIKILSIGVTLRYINSDLGGETSGKAFSADVALMMKLKGLNAAIAVSNLGTKVNYGFDDYSLPAMAKAGVAYNLNFAKSNRISVSVEGDYLIYKNEFMAGAGLEYSFKELISVRGGYHYGNSLNSIPGYASVGLGLKLFGVSVNGAYLFPIGDSPLKNTFSISLGWEF